MCAHICAHTCSAWFSMHWFGIRLTKLYGGKNHSSINFGGSLFWWSTLFHGLLDNINLLFNLHTLIFLKRKLSSYSLGPLIIEPSQGEDVFSGFLPDVPLPSLPVLVCPPVSLIHLPTKPHLCAWLFRVKLQRHPLQMATVKMPKGYIPSTSWF